MKHSDNRLPNRVGVRTAPTAAPTASPTRPQPATFKQFCAECEESRVVLCAPDVPIWLRRARRPWLGLLDAASLKLSKLEKLDANIRAEHAEQFYGHRYSVGAVNVERWDNGPGWYGNLLDCYGTIAQHLILTGAPWPSWLGDEGWERVIERLALWTPYVYRASLEPENRYRKSVERLTTLAGEAAARCVRIAPMLAWGVSSSVEATVEDAKLFRRAWTEAGLDLPRFVLVWTSRFQLADTEPEVEEQIDEWRKVRVALADALS